MKAVRWCAVCAVLIACEDEHQYDNTPPQPTNEPAERYSQSLSRPQPPASQAERTSAAESMAAARCEREQRCKNVGEGRKYATREACLAAVGKDWREELDDYECPGALVPNALAKCMEEIRNEDCLNPFDTLERLVDCDTNQVCANPNPQP